MKIIAKARRVARAFGGPGGPRYGTMTVPGKLEDGSDCAWFVMDRKTRESTLMGDGELGRRKAALEVLKLNERIRLRRRPESE